MPVRVLSLLTTVGFILNFFLVLDSEMQPLPLRYERPSPSSFVRVVKRRTTANKKERRRTQSINTAFTDLRECIPNVPPDTKLSKVSENLCLNFVVFRSPFFALTFVIFSLEKIIIFYQEGRVRLLFLLYIFRPVSTTADNLQEVSQLFGMYLFPQCTKWW